MQGQIEEMQAIVRVLFILGLLVFSAYPALGQVDVRCIESVYRHIDKDHIDDKLEEILINRKKTTITVSEYEKYKKVKAEEYDKEYILHFTFDWELFCKTGELALKPDTTKTPFDVFYFRGNTAKFFITTYGEQIVNCDYVYWSLMEHYYRSLKYSLKRIKKKSPQHILYCDMFPSTVISFMIGDKLKVMNVWTRETLLFEDYVRRHADEIENEMRELNRFSIPLH